MRAYLLTFNFCIILLLFGSSVSAAPISAVTSKIIYGWGDTLSITGSIGTSSATTLTATIYNSTGSVMNTTSTASSGGTPNTFSLTSVINSSYTPGSYFVLLTDGTDSVNMSFKVVIQTLTVEPYFIDNLGDVIDITTDTIINSSNSDYLGGDFTELINLSISKQLHYGNHSVGGKLYHFVLVDQTNTSTYDRLYIDDDTDFSLFNDTEDAEDIEYQALRKGSIFSNGTFRYVVGGVERTTGNKLILFKPAVGKPPYSTTDTVNLIVIVKNNTHLLSNQSVTLNVRNSSGQNVTTLTVHTANEFGWFNTSKELINLSAGFYFLDLNESLTTMPFPVEAFKLFVSTSDLSGTPTSAFALNSKVRVIISSRNTTSPIGLDSFSVTVYYPNGTVLSKTKSDFEEVATGLYRYDLDMGSASAGSYSITVSADYGSDTQISSTGFEIQSVNFDAMAINPRYIDEAESSGVMVNAFPPNSNVSIMTFLLNVSAGGIAAKEAEGFVGVIPVSDCNSSVTLTEVKDENGISYIDSIDYRVMNLSEAMTYFGETLSEPPPQQLLSQCMVIFPTPNKTGIYKAEVKINYQGEEKYAGVIFGVQRLFAMGATVDVKGDDFGFFAPNSTVRIKLKVRDLVTDQELPGTNITSGKIIEMYRVYPVFKDILGNSTLRTILNESIVNGTISFTSPADEGFYMMKFRFKANVGGQSETGIGDAFFMLKKYMIWGRLAGFGSGQWYVSQGRNITLTVTVLDIDKAQSLFGGYTTQRTCTGCSNFTIDISEIRNEQQFKRVTGYSVRKGYISNSTNPVTNVTIIPSADMQTGWYSVDFLVNDTGTGATYFGWGWFEIRNFWVDTRRASYNQSGDYFTYESEFDRGTVFPINSTVYFVLLPMNASEPSQLLEPDSVSLESLLSYEGWPPVPVTGHTASIAKETVKVCMEEDGEQVCIPQGNRYVVAISDLPEGEGEYQANVKIRVGSVSDVGTYWFSVSTYNVDVDYRTGGWPPLFASTENLTVNFTALDFDENPFNITNVTIDHMFSIKKGRPIKMRYGDNYTTACPESNFCQTNVYLSNLPAGEYVIEFAVIDETGDEKMQEVFFKLQDVIVSIPSMEEAWVWETNSVSKKVDNDVRRGQWTWCSDSRSDVPNKTKLCSDFCPEGSCSNFTLLAPNVSYSKEVFGYIPLMDNWAVGRFGSVANKSRMWMYANGSHMWINGTPRIVDNNTLYRDLGETTPIAIGDTFTDSKGGIWRLDTISDQSITLTGLTTLYGTGVLINTSYSKSGIIKLGQIRESDLGAYTPQGRKGIDLDGDGLTNGTVYFAIADSTSAGVYDTFFFSTDGNFTGKASPTVANPVSVSDNRENRIFGFGSNLTLLSIDSRAQGLRFYSKQVGDWAHMGEIKRGDNITIPIIVAAPDGSPRSANVSVTGYKNMRTWSFTSKNLVLNQNVTGIGELTFNSSELGGTGEYAFAIETDDIMEEWKWPMATVRGFLVDGELGEALYVGNFKPLDLREYRWDTPDVKIIRIRTDLRNATHTVGGVLAHAGMFDFGCGPDGECCNISQNGSVINNQVNWNYTPILKEYDTDQTNYWFYTNTTGGGERYLFKNDSGCNFNISALSGGLQKGNYTTIVKEGRTFSVSVLNIDTYNTTGECGGVYCWRAHFGIPGVNYSVIEPIVNNTDNNPDWGLEWGYMQNVSIFGTYYDVILANDSSYNYS
jgi:hypothetical protein